MKSEPDPRPPRLRAISLSPWWIAPLMMSIAPAATLYWDGTDSTANADGGSGIWDTTATNWDDAASAGNDATWINGEDATFGGTAGTVTFGEASLAAGTVTFDSPGYLVDSAGFDATWALLAGTGGFEKTGAGMLTLSGAGSSTGSVTLSEGVVSLGNDDALGTAAVTLDGGALSRNSTGTLTNEVGVASSGALIGRTVVDDYLTLSGIVSGSGTLTVRGLVELSNAANTFSGPLTLENSGAADPRTYLRLSASGVLDGTNDVTLSDTDSLLRLDGGVTQAIDELSGSGNVFASDVGSGLGTRLIVGSDDGTSSYAGTFRNNDAELTLEKAGTGTLTLNRGGGNDGAITGVEITAGTLALAGGAGFNEGYFQIPTPLTVGSGAQLEVAAQWNIATTNPVTIDGGTLTYAIGGANNEVNSRNYSNDVTIQNGGNIGGPWRTGNAAGTSLTSSGDATNTVSGKVYLVNNGSTVWTLDVADGVATTDLDITASIFDLGDDATTPALRGTVVRKIGEGTSRIAGNNLWDGGLVISSGHVTTANSGALGDGTATLGDSGTGASATSLLIETSSTLGNNLVVAADGTGTVTLGSTDSTSGSNRQFSGSLTLNRDVVLQAGASDRTTFAGPITGTGEILITSPFASGRRVVFERTAGPANDFVGDITLDAGAYLQIGVANAIGDRTSPDTATLHFTDAASSLRIAPGSGSTDSETVGSLASLAAGAGTVDLFFGNGATSFTLAIGGDDEDAEFSGTITNSGAGQLSIEKVGAGTQTFSGDGSYSGDTRVTEGTLALSSSLPNNLGTGDVSVASGAVLDVTGVTAPFGFNIDLGQTLSGAGTVVGTTEVFGTLSPGSSAGTLTFTGDLDLSLATGLEFELGPIASSDRIDVSGTLAIGTGVLGFSDFTFSTLPGFENGTYTLMTAGTLSGSLDAGDLSGALASGTGTLQINGNSIELVVAGALSPFESWISGAFANGTLDPADQEATDDPDQDGIDNAGEFAFDGDPTDPGNNGKVILVIADGDDSPDTSDELLLTAAVRVGAGEPFTGADSKTAVRDGIAYTFEGSLNLGSFDQDVSVQSAPVAPPGGLPALSDPAWEWMSFSLDASNGLGGRGFLRAAVDIP